MAEPQLAAQPPAAAPAEADAADEAEGFGDSDVLMDSVTKDEWKNIEKSLSYQKKAVCEMLKRVCSQVRTKGNIVLDDSNGKLIVVERTGGGSASSYRWRAYPLPVSSLS